ncbi:Stage III sporulation protein AE [Caprobacter fermentans]|uniref:Stage III sporulation protein AE n=1 Tax=Caproicibacter fermentans TaxID=2576756 RepID=A0A6N8I5Z1_9FIRM|nr:stage III sporulation protein AE [Caproicibacter fermentans]MVB12990.1 Stage III sporulation protein AE [Caproicibacter fermentans]QNK41258.1 stage III sporulation protein AE [Caproicibacter fermentans]
MKKAVCLIIAVAAAIVFSHPVFAAATESGLPQLTEEFYEDQLKQSGADELPDSLSPETKKLLGDLGVEGTDWNTITSISPQNYFQKILSVFTGQAKNPLKILCGVLAVILLCALLNGMKLSFGEKPMGGVIGMVGTLCICTIVVTPIVSCIHDAADVLNAASGFLLACIPVLTGIMIAAGQPVSAGSYHILMLAAGNAISILSTTFFIPMLNIFLALSIVSAVSPGINLSGLCAALNKMVKWIMGLCMTLFTSLITMHSIVASSLDNTGSKAAKFVVSSFVPVVGNALGEALQTVTGCVKLLKSGVSAFGLLAGIFIFLPIIAECMIWILTLNLCAGIGQIFDLNEISSLLKASSDVVSTMLAVLLCSMMILIISTVIMLVVGGVK